MLESIVIYKFLCLTTTRLQKFECERNADAGSGAGTYSRLHSCMVRCEFSIHHGDARGLSEFSTATGKYRRWVWGNGGADLRMRGYIAAWGSGLFWAIEQHQCAQQLPLTVLYQLFKRFIKTPQAHHLAQRYFAIYTPQMEFKRMVE